MNIDRLVVVRGAAVGLLIAMIAALANVVLADQHPKPKGALNATLVALLAGFVLAGFVVGLQVTHEAARHGAYAGLVVFVPVEIVGLLGRLDRGDPVSLPGIVILGFFAAGAGMFGARLGVGRRNRRHARSAGHPADPSFDGTTHPEGDT